MAARLALLALAGLISTIGVDREPAFAARSLLTSTDTMDANTVVVRARSISDLPSLAAAAQRAGLPVRGVSYEPPVLRATAPAGSNLASAIAFFRPRPDVLYAEPVFRIFRTADIPSDPLYNREAAYLQVEQAPAAWDVEKGDPSVVVAVLDSGIDRSHPDLKDRVWTNAAEIPDNGIDDDGNGCVDDVHGCAFVSDPGDGCSEAAGGEVDDDLGHGTFVSGVIAASGNGQGMVGVARGVTILPVKVLDCEGEGDSLALAQGLIYAARAGAKIMNVSLAGDIDSAVVREAARIAHDEFGAVIVAASGNSGKAGVAYPARYPFVLAVGAASGSDPDKRAQFSAYGPEIDVVAVGQDVVGTVPDASCLVFLPCIKATPYAVGDGTSFSTPQVAGLAALLLSHRPAMTADGVMSTIKATADPLPDGGTPGWDGAGRINMAAALTPRFRLGTPGLSKN